MSMLLIGKTFQLLQTNVSQQVGYTVRGLHHITVQCPLFRITADAKGNCKM